MRSLTKGQTQQVRQPRRSTPRYDSPKTYGNRRSPRAQDLPSARYPRSEIAVRALSFVTESQSLARLRPGFSPDTLTAFFIATNTTTSYEHRTSPFRDHAHVFPDTITALFPHESRPRPFSGHDHAISPPHVHGRSPVGEASDLRFQSGMSKVVGRGGRRYPPYGFTEQGVAMLSSVLRSTRAVEVNIEIMRAFVQLRRFLSAHREPAEKPART